MDKKLIWATVFLILFNLFFSPTIEYDQQRNLKVAQEIAKVGIPSYFGSNYLSNPPLMYYIHAFFIRVFGFHFFIHKLIDLVFWISAMHVLHVYGKITKNENVWWLVGLSWTMVFSTAIRSYSDALLFAALVFLFGEKFLRKPNWKSASILGLVMGIALWDKYSLGLLIPLFLIDLIMKKRWKPLKFFSISLVIATLFMAPLVQYANMNDLPLPWEISVYTNKVWRSDIPSTAADSLSKIINFWPVITVLAIMSLRLDVHSLCLIATPIIAPLILTFFEVRHFFFLIIPIAFLASKTIKKYKLNKWVKIWYAISYLIFIPRNITFMNEWGSFSDFCDSLQTNETVLGDHYNTISVFCDADGENLETFDTTTALLFGADYYISKEKEVNPYLKFYKNFTLKGPLVYSGDFFVYDIEIESIIEDLNLELIQIAKIQTFENDPIYRARCVVYGSDWQIPQISNKNGEILVLVPKNREGFEISCEALPYKLNTSRTFNLVMESAMLTHETPYVRY